MINFRKRAINRLVKLKKRETRYMLPLYYCQGSELVSYFEVLSRGIRLDVVVRFYLEYIFPLLLQSTEISLLVLTVLLKAKISLINP